MADKISTTYTLQMMAEFADGDTRTLNVVNPNTAVESLGARVYELQTFLQNNSVLVGDKNGAAFSRFSYANKVEKTQTVLDLGIS